MGNSDLTNNSSNSFLDNTSDTMKDPKSSKGAKAGAVALMGIAAVAMLGKAAIDLGKAAIDVISHDSDNKAK